MLSKLFVSILLCSLIVITASKSGSRIKPSTGSRDKPYKSLVQINCLFSETIAEIAFNGDQQPQLVKAYGQIRSIEVNQRCRLDATEIRLAGKSFKFSNEECLIKPTGNQLRWTTERKVLEWNFNCEASHESKPEDLRFMREDGSFLDNKALIELNEVLWLKNLSNTESCAIFFDDGKRHNLIENGKISAKIPEGVLVIEDRLGPNFNARLNVSQDLLEMQDGQTSTSELIKMKVTCSETSTRRTKKWRSGALAILNPKAQTATTSLSTKIFITLVAITILGTIVIGSIFVGRVCYREAQRFLEAHRHRESIFGIQKRIVEVTIHGELDDVSEHELPDYFENQRITSREQWPGDQFRDYSLSREFPLDFTRSTYRFFGTSRFQIPRANLTLGQELGAGSFGTVFEAKMLKVDGAEETVAVKLLPQASLSPQNEGVLRDFLIELANFQVLANRPQTEGHQHVVKLLATIFEDNNPMIVLEKCDSSLLKLLQRAGPLRKPAREIPIDTRLDFCWQIATGMAYLHENHFLHRDLASRNIMICSTAQGPILKITDFGLTRPVAKDLGWYRRKSTQTEDLPISWMAPEAIERQMYSRASDVWSFGVVMYEVLTYGSAPPGCRHRTTEYLKWLEHHQISIPAAVEGHEEFNGLLREHCFQRNAAYRSTFKQIRCVLQVLLEKWCQANKWRI